MTTREVRRTKAATATAVTGTATSNSCHFFFFPDSSCAMEQSRCSCSVRVHVLEKIEGRRNKKTEDTRQCKKSETKMTGSCVSVSCSSFQFRSSGGGVMTDDAVIAVIAVLSRQRKQLPKQQAQRKKRKRRTKNTIRVLGSWFLHLFVIVQAPGTGVYRITLLCCCFVVLFCCVVCSALENGNWNGKWKLCCMEIGTTQIRYIIHQSTHGIPTVRA